MAQGSGSITSLNGTINVQTEGYSAVTFSITGTWIATLVIEATVDDSNWFSITATNLSALSVINTFSSNLECAVSCSSFSQVRLRTSAYTSGTLSITWDVSSSQNLTAIVMAGITSSSPPEYQPGVIAQISLNDAGCIRVDGSNVTQPVIIESANNFVTSSIAALNQSVTFGSNSFYTGTTCAVEGTWSGTLSFEGTVDGENTWFPINALNLASGVIVTSTTGNGNFRLNSNALEAIRVRFSAYSSGTANIYFFSMMGDSVTSLITSLPSGTNTIGSIKLLDGSGNVITSTTEASKQSLDITPIATAVGYYSVPVNIRQSAATAANATVFSMRNASSSTKTVYISRIELLMAFDSGTPLTRSLQRYDLVRFSSATPSGGTAVTVVPMDSSAFATQVTDVRFLDTGLTTTGVSFGTPFATIACPATDATTTKYQRANIALKLAAGEGFCIRLDVAAVVGQSLAGEIVWSEL